MLIEINSQNVKLFKSSNSHQSTQNTIYATQKHLDLVRAQEILPTFKLDGGFLAIDLDLIFGQLDAPVCIFGKFF
jgi:hypothetical protein